MLKVVNIYEMVNPKQIMKTNNEHASMYNRYVVVKITYENIVLGLLDLLCWNNNK